MDTPARFDIFTDLKKGRLAEVKRKFSFRCNCDIDIQIQQYSWISELFTLYNNCCTVKVGGMNSIILITLTFKKWRSLSVLGSCSRDGRRELQ